MSTTTGQYIYRHKPGFACKIVKRFSKLEVVETFRDTLMVRGYVARLCECGHYQNGSAVVGRYSDRRECDARCMGATGPSCECSCSGANHGASY